IIQNEGNKKKKKKKKKTKENIKDKYLEGNPNSNIPNMINQNNNMFNQNIYNTNDISTPTSNINQFQNDFSNNSPPVQNNYCFNHQVMKDMKLAKGKIKYKDKLNKTQCTPDLDSGKLFPNGINIIHAGENPYDPNKINIHNLNKYSEINNYNNLIPTSTERKKTPIRIIENKSKSTDKPNKKIKKTKKVQQMKLSVASSKLNEYPTGSSFMDPSILESGELAYYGLNSKPNKAEEYSGNNGRLNSDKNIIGNENSFYNNMNANIKNFSSNFDTMELNPQNSCKNITEVSKPNQRSNNVSPINSKDRSKSKSRNKEGIPKLKSNKSTSSMRSNKNLPQYNTNRLNLILDNSFCLPTDLNKFYAKSKKSIINMSRGILTFNKQNFIDYKSYQLKYYKFIRPTEPIIEVNYQNINKYKTITKGLEFQQNEYEMSQREETKRIKNKTNKSPFKEPNLMSNSPYLIKQKDPEEEIIPKRNKSPLVSNFQVSQNTSNNENINSSYMVNLSALNSSNVANDLYFNNFESGDNQTVPMTVKTKIYLWLIDIGIIKDQVINMLDLPKICINGVLLSDLINRCEGRNEAIKGIIRKTTNKSQIQVNINKVLDFLRSKEKFKSRHLWKGDEISKGDKKVIWELLHDLFSFYKHNNYFPKSKSKNKTQRNNSSNLSFTQRENLLEKASDGNLNKTFNMNIPLKTDINPPPYFTSERGFTEITPEIKNKFNSNRKQNKTERMETRSAFTTGDYNSIYNTSSTNAYVNSNNFNHILNQEDSKMFNFNKSNRKEKIPRPKSQKNIILTEDNISHIKNYPTQSNLEEMDVSVNRRISKNNSSNLLIKSKSSKSFFVPNKTENNNVGGFLLFEKSSANKMKDKINQFSQLNYQSQRHSTNNSYITNVNTNEGNLRSLLE
ncbi:MAG: calponin homology domain-containing protein, partial [archaeon]|nr:calponin homology domain-containing protein [archaeon]